MTRRVFENKPRSGDVDLREGQIVTHLILSYNADCQQLHQIHLNITSRQTANLKDLNVIPLNFYSAFIDGIHLEFLDY